jgi:hypothetical protein
MTSKDTSSASICQVCNHDMKRSRVKFVKDGGSRLYQLLTIGAEVRCNKCKTVFTVKATFPEQNKILPQVSP